MNSTNLTEALDFTWNHSSNDVMYYLQNYHLSIGERFCKKISDCAVYVFASILGMSSIEKIADSRISIKTLADYNEYIKINSNINLQNQSVILIINGESDIPVSPKIYEDLEKQTNCKIKFLKINSLEEIGYETDLLLRSNNKIKALWVRAHGAPTAISFGQGTEIKIAPVSPFDMEVSKEKINKTKDFLTGQLNKLEIDAPIILESCFTGQKMENGQDNVAQFIASAAMGRKVYAPSREALPIENTSFSKEEGLKIVMKSFQPSNYFAKGSCLARMSAIWHAFRNHQEEITCEFKK